ncbi:MAG: SusC/RagA family TonB-linked outer membrane protein [Bacteroidota bacterium]
MKNIRIIILVSLLLLVTAGMSIHAQERRTDSLAVESASFHPGYAAESVDQEALKHSSALDPQENLFGRFAGLWVMQNGGFAGDRDPDLFIRGRGTFRSAYPLVLVDGVERKLSSYTNAEIESVTVLKDGASLALFGMRGANGAILVTTKRGREEGFNVNVSYDRGLNQAFRIPKFLDGYGYAMAVNEASALDGDPWVYSQMDLDDYRSGEMPELFPTVDWFDEAFREFGSTTEFSADFSGGGDRAKYFVLLNYQNERGLFDQTNPDDRYSSELQYDRFNLRINTDIDLTSSAVLRVDVAGSIVDNQRPSTSTANIMKALYKVPSGVFPVKTVNNIWGGTSYYGNNPAALIAATGQYTSQSTKLNVHTTLFQDLDRWVEGLSAEASVAYDNSPTYYQRKQKDFLYESTSLERDPVTGVISDTIFAQYGSETDFETGNGLGWQNRSSAINGKLNYVRELETGLLTSALLYNQEMLIYTGQYNTYLYQDLSALASYAHMDKYFLNLSLTYGGNSMLPEENRYGIFPGVSAAWRISEESFLEESNLVSLLQLRASWGKNGNGSVIQNLEDQHYNSSGNYYFTDNLKSYSGIAEGFLASPGIMHASATKYDLGLDLQLLKQIDLTVDLFYEKRTGILSNSYWLASSVLGTVTPFNNDGVVENRGVDASLVWSAGSDDLNYYLGANFAFARNRVLEMNEPYLPHDYLKSTGRPVGQQFGLVTEGFFGDDEEIASAELHTFSPVRPGDIRYVDQNGDGEINQYDVVALGYASGVPEIYYSLSMGVNFKGIGLDLLLQGTGNQTGYLNTDGLFWPLRNQTGISAVSAGRWTPETAETATLPRLSMKENANNYRRNDIWLADVSYLKLRYLDLYFDLPVRVTERMKMSSFRIYLRGMNLFSIDALGVVDPEATGITYPTLASYHAGIRIGF